MPIPNIENISNFDESSVPIVNKVLDDIRAKTPMIRQTDTNFTVSEDKVQNDEFVVYDDGSTARLYIKLAGTSIGYVTITKTHTA